MSFLRFLSKFYGKLINFICLCIKLCWWFCLFFYGGRKSCKIVEYNLCLSSSVDYREESNGSGWKHPPTRLWLVVKLNEARHILLVQMDLSGRKLDFPSGFEWGEKALRVGRVVKEVTRVIIMHWTYIGHDAKFCGFVCDQQPTEAKIMQRF